MHFSLAFMIVVYKVLKKLNHIDDFFNEMRMSNQTGMSKKAWGRGCHL